MCQCRTQIGLRCRLTSLALLGVLAIGGLNPSAAQIAVVAHQQVPADSLSRRELLDYYTGDIQTWTNGRRVVLYDLRNNEQMRTAFYDYLGKTSSRMKAIWLRRKLSGEGAPPLLADDEHDLVDTISRTEGSIGFAHLDLADSLKMKVLLVIPDPAENN